MTHSILTESDVIYYSGINLQSLQCDFRLINRIILYEFRTVLGIKLLEAMSADLIDTTEAKTYTSGVLYELGDLVKHKGKFYNALKQTSSQPPLNTAWQPSQKFKSPCYNSLFCDFGLGEYLSHKILIDRLPHLLIKVGASGAIKKRGQDFEAASHKDNELLIRSHVKAAGMALDNLDWYIKTKKESKCYSGYLPLIADCCSNCGVSKTQCSCENGNINHLYTQSRYRVAK